MSSPANANLSSTLMLSALPCSKQEQPTTSLHLSSTLPLSITHTKPLSHALHLCHSLQGKNTILVADAGQLDKFKKRFGGLGDLAEVGAAAGASGPATEDESAKKIGGSAKAAGKKKRR